MEAAEGRQGVQRRPARALLFPSPWLEHKLLWRWEMVFCVIRRPQTLLLRLHDPRGTREVSWNTEKPPFFFDIHLQGDEAVQQKKRNHGFTSERTGANPPRPGPLMNPGRTVKQRHTLIWEPFRRKDETKRDSSNIGLLAFVFMVDQIKSPDYLLFIIQLSKF